MFTFILSLRGYTPIFTEADDLESLREMVKDAVDCHYDDIANRPKIIRLHIVRDEVIAVSNYHGIYPVMT